MEAVEAVEAVEAAAVEAAAAAAVAVAKKKLHLRPLLLIGFEPCHFSRAPISLDL